MGGVDENDRLRNGTLPSDPFADAVEMEAAAVRPTAVRPALRPVPADGRPEIRIGTDIQRMVDQAIEALAQDPETYQRSGALVHVAHVAENDASRRAPFAVGTPTIKRMAKATLRERLSSCARWLGRDVQKECIAWIERRPPDDVVAAVFERGAWRNVRELVGVSGTPVFRPDGEIVQTQGFDPVTGYLYLPSVNYPRIPDAPARADAETALAALTDVFADVPFTDESRSVPIAALMTLLLRPAILGAIPAFVFNATTPGSGKTLVVSALSYITEGCDAAHASWPGDDEELEKILGAYLLAGVRLIPFDNVTKPFKGAPLDRALTSRETIATRILGESTMAKVPWASVVVAGGNGVEVAGDTTRRVLYASIEPDCERPDERPSKAFRYPDLFGHLRQHRAELVAAVLTIARAWVVAGRPACETRVWGSFEEWSRIVPPALVFAGAPDPMRARLASEEDPDRRAHATILAELPKLDGAGIGLSLRELVGHLYPGGRPPGPDQPPDGFDELREALEHFAPAQPGRAPSTTTLGNRLKPFRGRLLGTQRLVTEGGGKGVQRWRVDTLRKEAPRDE